MNNGIAARRMALRRNPRFRFVNVEEFLVMATSRRQLIRAADEAAGLLGLHDPETGETTYIEHEQLDRAKAIAG